MQVLSILERELSKSLMQVLRIIFFNVQFLNVGIKNFKQPVISLHTQCREKRDITSGYDERMGVF